MVQTNPEQTCRKRPGMLLTGFILLFGLLILVSPVVSQPERGVIFAPNGGFSPENQRPVQLRNGREIDPNLNVYTRKLIRQVPSGGRIEIAMYAFSDMNTVETLVDRAKDDVEVRLLLDGCTDWTKEIRRTLLDEFREEKEEAKTNNRPFSVQIKLVTCKQFQKYDRSLELEINEGRDANKVIHGAMHEKFGVFFPSREEDPTGAFAGSANFSRSAATKYAENRTFYRDDPHSARQLHEEFQRLWKYWGKCTFGDCEKVDRIIEVEPDQEDGVEMIFNSEAYKPGASENPQDIDNYWHIDWAIAEAIDQVDPEEGTIELAMFYFSDHRLMYELLEAAEEHPSLTVRILLDQSMMYADNPDRPAVLGPMMEKEVRKRKLENVHIRYKWRSNAYGYDAENPDEPPALQHHRSQLLHHKMVILDRDVLMTGSYNWTEGAEARNLENIQIFRRSRGHDAIIDRFQREYQAIWEAKNPLQSATSDQFRSNPQVISGPEGRKLRRRIIRVLSLEGSRAIQFALDRADEHELHIDQLVEKTGLSRTRIRTLCERFREVTLLRKTGGNTYAYAD